jgi:hypothetical protein
MTRHLADLAAAMFVGAACAVLVDTLELATGQRVRDLDGRLIPAKVNDADLAEWLGGAR